MFSKQNFRDNHKMFELQLKSIDGKPPYFCIYPYICVLYTFEHALIVYREDVLAFGHINIMRTRVFNGKVRRAQIARKNIFTFRRTL